MIVHVQYGTHNEWMTKVICMLFHVFCWGVIAKMSFLLLPKEYVFLHNALIVGMYMVIPGVSVS